MAEPQALDTQAAILAKAKEAQAARERAIDANGVKRGRQLEREEIQRAAGVATLDEISLLAQVRLEHDAKLQAFETRWEREEAKHGRYRFWQGMALGGVIAGLGWGAFQLYTFNAISDTIAQTTRQDVMTGAIVRAHSEGEQ